MTGDPAKIPGLHDLTLMLIGSNTVIAANGVRVFGVFFTLDLVTTVSAVLFSTASRATFTFRIRYQTSARILLFFLFQITRILFLVYRRLNSCKVHYLRAVQ